MLRRRRHARALSRPGLAALVSVTCGLGLVACADMAGGDDGAETWSWALPRGFPEPLVPDDNPMSEAKVELGRHLFYDRRLSANETQSCADCHDQQVGFTDRRPVGVGSTGEAHVRNSQGLTNVAYMSSYTWANPNLTTLEQQIHLPLFGEFPVELGVTGNEDEVLARFRGEVDYVDMFRDAFPEANPSPDAVVNFDHAIKAMAAFVRTMISGESDFDRWAYQDDRTALSESAVRGMNMFFEEELECHHCHGGFNFSLSSTHQGQAFDQMAFHNNGLYNLDGEGAYPTQDPGLYEFTGLASDMGRFRAPSLRNVSITGPYMHDGSIETLDEVIDMYAAGGQLIESGPMAGDGRQNPHKSGFVNGFALDDQQRADLHAFLESLTDEDFLSDPRFSNPWE